MTWPRYSVAAVRLPRLAPLRNEPMPDPLDPLGFLAATERLRRGLSIVPQVPPEHVVAAPGLGSRVLEGVGAVVGAPKAAVDALLRASGRNVFDLALPEDYTTGRAIRELAGLSVEPGIADPGTSESYAKRLAGAALEFGGDILTDPTVAAIAAKAPAAVTRLAAPLRAAAPALDVAIPAVVPQAAGAAFTGLMTAGALESGRQAAETIGREGLSPQAAEELFHTGAAGLGALAGAGHIASRVRELRRLRAERGAPTAEAPEVELPPEVQSAVPPEVWAGDVPPGFEPRRAPAGPFPFPEAAFSPESEPFTLPVEVQAELVRRGETLPARRTLALEPRLPFVEGELVVERPELYPIGLDVPAIDAEFVRPLETLAERAAREQLTAPPTALALPEPLRQLPAPRPEVQQQPTLLRPEAQLPPAVPQLERAETAPVPLPEVAEVVPQAAPGFDAWARERGISVDPGNRSGLVQQWLRENPEVTPEQREAVRIGARRGPSAAAYEEPARPTPLEVDRDALDRQARERARELVPDDEAAASLKAHEELLRRPGRTAVEAGYDGGIKEALGLEAMPQKASVLATAIKRDQDNPVYLEAVARHQEALAERRAERVARGEELDAVEPSGPVDANFDPGAFAVRRAIPGQRGLFGPEGDVAVPVPKPRAPEQQDLFRRAELLVPTEARVTEGREASGPLFQQEVRAAARADAARQATLPDSVQSSDALRRLGIAPLARSGRPATDVLRELDELGARARTRRLNATDPDIRGLHPSDADWMTPDELDRLTNLQADLVTEGSAAAAQRVSEKRALRLAAAAERQTTLPGGEEGSFATREQDALKRDRLADDVAAEFRDQEITNPKLLRAEVERAMGRPYEPPARPMTAARIRQAFPGVKLEERAGVYRGRINGVEVEVHPDATITVRDPKQAAAFARSATARGIEAGQAEAVGLTQSIDRRVIVRLAKGVDDAVVNHEALHVAMRLALNDKERRATLRKYGFDESSFKGTAEERTAAMRLAEERAAEAYSEWNPREPNGIFKRIATFFKNLYRQLFPDAEEVFRRVRSGEAFARGAAGDDLGAAFASRRRPLSESLWQKVLHPNRLPSFDIWFRDREGRLPSAQEAQGEAFAQYEREVNSPDGLRERALYEMSKSPELRTERLAKLDKMIESRAGVLSQIANAFESGRGGERTTADLDAARGVVRELRALTSARDTIRSRAEQEGYLTERGLDPYPDQVDFAVRQHARATKAAPPTADERIETEPIGRPVEPGESPRVEQRVEDLRKAERDVGQPPAELDRETRRTWKSLDPEIRRVLREYDDDRFYNILKRRQLDDVEVQAWDARVRGKQERLDELDAEISSGRAAGRDVAEQERLSTAAALDYIAAQRAAVNDGTGTARALAARARVMEASRTPDDAFLRRVFREIPGVTDKQSAQLLKAFREDPSNLRPLLHQALATGKLRKALEWWKAGLLSAFSTDVANVSGSLAEHHIGLIETGVAAGVDKALSSLLGGPRARFAGEFGAELAGGNTAFPAALRSLGRGLRDAVLLREKPFDPGRRIEYQVGAIGGTLGKVVRVPFARLAAEDEFFKAWGGGAELGKLVHRKAASAGGSKDQIKARAARIAQELADPQNTDHIEILRAVERSKAERTFQERRPGSATEAITQIVQRQPLLNIALPFVHTPGNIANRILERSPYGFKRAVSVYKNYRRIAREGASPEALAEARGQVADAIARPLVGTAVLAGFTGLAKAGALTGSGPNDPKERNLLRDTGWQPYSFVFTNTEGRKVYVPFNRFEPVSSLLGFAADLSEAQNSKTAGDLFDKGVGSVVQNLTSKSYLQGLTDAAELLSDPKRFGGQYVRNLTGSVVPNIVARAARVVDSTVRDVRPDEPGLKGLAESSVAAVVARLPFLSRTLQPRRSGTGEQVERSGSGVAQFFIPAPPSTEREGRDLERLLVEVDAVPSAPRRQIRVAGREIDLTAEEYAAMQDVDKRTTDLLRQSAATPEFQRLSSEQKRLLFKKAYDASRNAARKIIMTRPEFRRRLLSVVRGAA